MCDIRERPSNEGWRPIAGYKGLGIDSMNAMMTQIGCSKKGDSMVFPHRKGPMGDHKNMSTRWYLMMKIDTNKEKYGDKVVPQVQVL